MNYDGLNSRVLFSLEVMALRGEKLMLFPGPWSPDPPTRLAAGLAGKFLSTTHAKKDLTQTVPTIKLALYKQYLQRILVPVLCHATFSEMITCLC